MSTPISLRTRMFTILAELARANGGNTGLLLAAAVLPVLAIVGGSIDMGRMYLVQSRMQAACDSAVLVARKRLGAGQIPDGGVPDEVVQAGTSFFNNNFRSGSYGTVERSFAMTLENDFAITGHAEVLLPATIMAVFGLEMTTLEADCEAQVNFNTDNVDIMMVLDTTGSMNQVNPGDSTSRFVALKNTIADFHNQVQSSMGSGGRARFGFVPYGSNVNVGGLLKDEWVSDTWHYQSREINEIATFVQWYGYDRNKTYVSGTFVDWHVIETFPATYTPDDNSYYCADPGYEDTATWPSTEISSYEEPQPSSDTGTMTISVRERVTNGTEYKVDQVGTTCEVSERSWTDYIDTFEAVSWPETITETKYLYDNFERDVANWRTETAGCIEERKTTEITDFSNVDLTQNMDLDLDTLPTPGDRETQWHPHYASEIYARRVGTDWEGDLQVSPRITGSDYLKVGETWRSSCPAPSQKLQEMDSAQLSAYLATLTLGGGTYHDIGMIWGGRLLSPTGLFADENADLDGKTTKRHLIFLTDGQTEGYELAYTAYGLEPLDRRRWTQESPEFLNVVVENRFKFVCDEVKKRNITIWVIAFGTTLNPAMTACAGAGHHFEAENAAQLGDAFSAIGDQVGDLRLTR